MTSSETLQARSASVQRLIYTIIHSARIQVLISISLIWAAGITIASDYGQGWDEHLNVIYGQESLRAYSQGENAYVWSQPEGPTGPAYFMLVEIVAAPLGLVLRSTRMVDIRHMIHFTTFVVGAYFTYRLARRFSNHLSSLLAAWLYLTMPLLFGHSFINAKDIPFMVFFAVSVELGLTAADHLSRSSEPISGLFRSFEDRPQIADLEIRARHVAVLGLSAILIWLALDVLILHDIVLPTILRIVHQAATENSGSLINSAFRALAQERATTEIEAYLWKATRLFWGVRWFLALVLLAPITVVLTRRYSESLSRIWTDRRIPLLVGASLVLGFLWSMRSIGPLAGILVSIYFILKVRRRALRPLIAYGILSISSSLLTRPYFLQSPIQRVLDSVTRTSGFAWDGNVLFAGKVYSSGDLPPSYNPSLLLTQLTEPLLLLVLLGVCVSLARTLRRGGLLPGGLVLLLWVAVPLAIFLLVDAQFYDNFRQLLFLVPPLFVVASIGFEWIGQISRSPAVLATISTLILLPGIIHLVALHPYQYIYYNSLLGGVRGTYRDYELDYWCTSLREAVEYVNRGAGQGETVAVNTPLPLVEPYARPDLNLVVWSGATAGDQPQAVLICARTNRDLTMLPESPIKHRVEVLNLTLAVVKEP